MADAAKLSTCLEVVLTLRCSSLAGSGSWQKRRRCNSPHGVTLASGRPTISHCALSAGAESVSEVGRRTSVSKQAAAKTVAFLEEGAYVVRSADAPGRRAHLLVTDRGRALMHEGEAVFDELRAQWESIVGRDRIADVQDALQRLLDA